MPSLLVLPSGTDLHEHAMVKDGRLVLQGMCAPPPPSPTVISDDRQNEEAGDCFKMACRATKKWDLSYLIYNCPCVLALWEQLL